MIKKYILNINTSSPEEIIISLSKDNNSQESIQISSKNIAAKYRQSEKLLVSIDKLLSANKISLRQLKKIIVVNYGHSFTALRIGVITANALAYALKIPVEGDSRQAPDTNSGIKNKFKSKTFSGYSIVEPIYDREANIGLSKKSQV